jgi:hypothetical protein
MTARSRRHTWEWQSTVARRSSRGVLALIAFVELEVTLTAVAIGISLRGRSRAITLAATAVGASATALGLASVWMVWFVAPWCVADPNLVACAATRAGDSGFVYVAEIAALEWAWMVGVALLARFVAARNLAHVSS